MKKIIAFPWYGGKFRHLDWLLPLLPGAKHYCEPFGGGASVLLNRRPARIETYNDIYGDVVNFFQVLRDNREKLIELLMLTPYSRQEYIKSVENNTSENELERARLFYVRARQCWGGIVQCPSKGRWGYVITDATKTMARTTSAWRTGVEYLDAVADRLLRVQLDHDEALRVIERYDTEDTFFYCDPPYPMGSRNSNDICYQNELSDDDHVQLSKLLHAISGRAAISGYSCNLTNELYKDWTRIVAPVNRFCNSQAERQEVLWCNYDPYEKENLLFN